MADDNVTPPISERIEVSERIGVSLIPKASRELAELRASTAMSRSDLVNRAISLYAFIDRQLADGAELAMRMPNGDVRIVHLT